MANTHKFVVKNGLQAQNISFRDSFLGNHTITASIDASDTLSFEGDAGQLFSIVDSMGGTIFSVNDISGIPSIEVDDDGEIRLAEFSGHVLIGTDSSLDTSKHIVQIAGGLNADSATIDGTVTATSFSGSGASLTSLNASNISSGTISDARLPATISSDITGNAATATTATSATSATSATTATTATNVTATANNSTNETVYLTFVDGATGSQGIETDTSLVYNPSTNLLAIASDTDISAEIGRAHVGYVGHSDYAGFSHVDQNGTGTFALMQAAGGTTYLNAPSGQAIYLRNANTTIASVGGSGLLAVDNKWIAAGTGADLQMLHNGSNSFITNAIGDLSIIQYVNDKDILIQSDDGSGGTTDYFRADGSTGEAKLYYYGSEKLKTQATGIDVTGEVVADSATFTNVSGNGSGLTSLNASNLGSGTVPSARLSLSASDIPNLAASKITSGIFDSARIPPGAFTTGGGGASVSVSSTAPSSPSEGDLWFDDENATLLIYYDDGNGAAQWVSSVAGPSDFGLDSAEAIAIFDSAYIQARAGSPTTVQPAATSSTDTEVFPLFVEASSTTEQSVKVDGGLKYNANTNALTAGSFITSATGAITLDDGHIDIQSDTSVSAYIDLYCEAGTHYARLTAPAHSAFSGNITSTLPATTTTLAGLAVAQTFTATQTFNGTALFNGDVHFGNATTDFVTFTAGVTPGVRIADPGNGNSSNSLVIAAATGKTGDLINATVNSVEKFVVDASGNITAGGDVTAANFVSSSDRRLKKDIQTISSPLFKVQNLRGVSYIKNDKEEVGVIAQEVETVMPEVVNTGKDGYKSVAYGNMVGLLIEAIKEQQGQIEILKEEINSLKGV